MMQSGTISRTVSDREGLPVPSQLHGCRGIPAPCSLRGPPAAGRTSGRPCSARLTVWIINPEVSPMRSREGLPVPIETALLASAARRAKAQPAWRERRPGMAGASVRRDGTGNPELTRKSHGDACLT